MHPQKIIATYARVSTAKQEEEQTIKNQIEACKEFAAKNKYCIVKEYIDEGWSGDILARPALDALRQDAKTKQWEALLIYDPDRLARRYSYQELVMDELRETGIEVLFITVSTPKNNEDKILHGVRGLFAEYERAKISERFRLGKLRKLKEGHILTSEPKYGYTYIPKQGNTHGYCIINEVEAKVVQMIFELVAGGMTLKKVVKHLQELGIRPRRSKRGVWNTSTLGTLLRHKIYIGEAHWGKSYAIVPLKPLKTEKYRKMRKTSRRDRPEEEWYKTSAPAIISKELFEKAGRQLEINYARANRNKKNNYLLSGKIKCVCGVPRCGEGPQKGKHLYYRCANRVYNYPLPPTCHEKGINARKTDTLVWEGIISLMTSPNVMKDQISRWVLKKKSQHDSDAIDTIALQKNIQKLKQEEERYNKAYGAGIFNIVQLKEYTSSVREKITSLERQVSKTQSEQTTTNLIMPSENEIEAFAKEASTQLTNLSFEEKYAIIGSVVDKVIASQKELQVIGHIPISSNVKLHPFHRYSRDAMRQNFILHLRQNNTPDAIENNLVHRVRFDMCIPLPTPLERGIDYGFRKAA